MNVDSSKGGDKELFSQQAITEGVNYRYLFYILVVMILIFLFFIVFFIFKIAFSSESEVDNLLNNTENSSNNGENQKGFDLETQGNKKYLNILNSVRASGNRSLCYELEDVRFSYVYTNLNNEKIAMDIESICWIELTRFHKEDFCSEIEIEKFKTLCESELNKLESIK